MNELEQYLMSIGQRVLAEQAAQQQQQQPPQDLRVSQANRNHAIMSQLAQQKQQQQIEMAKQREAKFAAEREMQREREAQERAERAEVQLKAEIIAAWDAANLPRSGLDAATMSRLLKEKQIAHMESYQQKLRRGPAADAF